MLLRGVMPQACLTSFCGIYYLPDAMHLVCGLLIISSLAILTPVTFLCHLSVIQENNYLSITAGIAVLIVSILVFIALLFNTNIHIHLALNFIWWIVACVHIVSTMYLFIYYIVVKPLNEEGCTVGAVIFFISWFFNMVMMGCGLLVYWSTLLYMHNWP